jgi:protein phosphatase PTC7
MKGASNYCQHHLMRRSNKLFDSTSAIYEGFNDALNQNIKGSTTACVIGIQEVCEVTKHYTPSFPQLRASNIGDSGFMLVRNGEILLRSQPRQLFWNCPHQFGHHTDQKKNDEEMSVDQYTFPLKEGDFIIAASDGFFDNLWDQSILTCLKENIHLPCTALSRRLAYVAQTFSLDPEWTSPFAVARSEEAKKQHSKKKIYVGGKEDDITVLVCQVKKKPVFSFQPPPSFQNSNDTTATTATTTVTATDLTKATFFYSHCHPQLLH